MPELRSILTSRVKEFPQAMQDEIIVVFFEEALRKKTS